jgi:hypothetical protein
MSHGHVPLTSVPDLAGFAAENVQGPGTARVLTRALLTSDEPEFYTHIDQLTRIFFQGKSNGRDFAILGDAVFQFLVLIHEDLSGDLYINDFRLLIEIRSKRDVQRGELIRKKDIADVRRLKFPDIQIMETDSVIYCGKVGWKFGLFFDLNKSLDLNKLEQDLGSLYRYLSFQNVYNALEAKVQFEEMLSDGWFPFVEIIGGEYDILIGCYQNKFDFENRVSKIISRFDRRRIENVSSKWWSKKVFEEKKLIIEAGIAAYLSGDEHGYINCIKNLLSEIEGIIRVLYFRDTGKDPKFADLIQFIVDKGKVKSGSDYSLILPIPFLQYLKYLVFENFDLKSGKVNLSRHSSGHGVADAAAYTKMQALQAILTLDQIFFYL